MAEKRYLHLNLVANDINLHQGAYKYEQAHGVPERTASESLRLGRRQDERAAEHDRALIAVR